MSTASPPQCVSYRSAAFAPNMCPPGRLAAPACRYSIQQFIGHLHVTLSVGEAWHLQWSIFLERVNFGSDPEGDLADADLRGPVNKEGVTGYLTVTEGQCARC